MMGTPLLLALTLVLAAAPPLHAQEDVDRHPSCRHCGMDRRAFAHARVLVEYADGASEGLCSLHCAAVDLALNVRRSAARIGVGDYETRQLVDARRATWVIEGDIPGVMTQRAKWAFASPVSAVAFTTRNGGRIAGFEEALRAAYEDLERDAEVIRGRSLERPQQPDEARPGP